MEQVTSENLSTNEETSATLTFLKKTKEGKFAKIDEESMSYLRYSMAENTCEEQYYYSVR